MPRSAFQRIRNAFCWCLLFFAIIVVILTAAYYPRTVDVVSSADPGTARKDYRAFYEDAYASVNGTADPKIESSYNVRGGPENTVAQRDPQVAEIRDFVQEYGLQGKRVLEVGAGDGKLQDLVADYTGLDISSTAKRFFHKRFIAGSATALPFEDNKFDVIWTINVLEHVPKPEQALSEMRRVLKGGGLMYLSAAWHCRSWHADGYDVRPYDDFNIKGKFIKASIPLRDSLVFRSLYTFPVRFIRLSEYELSGRSTSFMYSAIAPNYTHFWEADSDAVNSMDPYEAMLWFRSRGDSIQNPNGALRQFFFRTGVVIIRIQK
jgi:ubiquinone/menaquinone biosynthesis C-methylase UbiE